MQKELLFTTGLQELNAIAASLAIKKEGRNPELFPELEHFYLHTQKLNSLFGEHSSGIVFEYRSGKK